MSHLDLEDHRSACGGARHRRCSAFCPLSFFAGLFVPLQVLPAFLRHVGEWTPLGAAVDATQRAMKTGRPTPSSLVVPAIYALIFAVVRESRDEHCRRRAQLG